VVPSPGENECVARSLRTVLDYFEPGAITDWNEVQAMIPHNKDEGVLPSDLLYALLDRDYTIEVVSDYSDERFLQEGLPYLEEYYRVRTESPNWDPADFYAFWTDEQLEEHRLTTIQDEARPKGPRYHHIQAPPTLDIIKNFLLEGKPVHAVALSPEGETHSYLITGFYPGDNDHTLFTLVNFIIDSDTLYVASDVDMLDGTHWIPEEGIFAISR
jgi:hypothetical protein